MLSSRPTTALARLAAAGVAAVLLAACGASGSQESSPSASSAETSDSSTSESSSTTESSTTQSSTTQPPSTSTAPTSDPGGTGENATAILDAPDPARGEHRPAVKKGRGNAVITIRHHPGDAPVRAVIVNQGAQDFTARVQTGTGPDATTLDTYRENTRGPVELTAEATAIRIESSGPWIVKLLPRRHHH